MTTYSGKRTGRTTSSGRSRGFSAEITIDGLEDTIAALRALEPEVLKAMQAEIRAAALDVAGKAGQSFAATGHGTGDYRVRSATRGKRTGMRIFAAGKEEAMFELAGTKMQSWTHGPITPQGAAMVRWLDRFGKPGRFLWPAWRDEEKAFQAKLEGAIGKAEQVIQRKLDAAGEVY